ncbi:hypothetical protein GW17_00048147 [Ensete ventricosum]|nr:hypothetical protein GW17_00048147 [Ensete ventricosum]
MTTGRHKSRCGEGGSRAHSKGKEPATSNGEPIQPSFRCPKLMKELCETTIRKDDKGYYALHMTNLSPRDLDFKMRARWKLRRTWPGSGILHPQLAKELYSLPSEVLLARVTKHMVWWVADLGKDCEQLQAWRQLKEL